MCVGGGFISAALWVHGDFFFFFGLFFFFFFSFFLFGVLRCVVRVVMENSFVNIISFQTNETTRPPSE